MRRSVILLLSILTLFSPVLGAEEKEVSFGTAEGLSNGSVTCLFQDSSQMLWIGTWDGLNMFDGHRFKTWKFDPGNPQTLSNNIIRNIVEEKKGIIWIATDHGINRMDVGGGTVSRFYPGFEDRMPSVEESFDVAVSDDGTVFCSSLGWGLSWFDPQSQRLVSLNIPQFNTSVIKRIFRWDESRMLLQTSDKKLYVAAFRHEGEAMTMESAAILEQSPEAVSVSQSRDGLVIVAPGNEIWCKRKESSSPVRVGTLDPGDEVMASSVSDQGKVYVALNHSGIWSSKGEAGGFAKERMAESAGILSMYLGSQDILWIGSDGKGVIECFDSGLAFNKTTAEEIFPMRASPVRAFWESDDGTLFIGSKGSGIAECHPGGSFSWIGTAQGLSDNAVYCISPGLYDGHILIGSDGEGMDLYFPARKKVVPLKPAPGTNWRFVYSIYPDPERDCVWIGTNGYGLVKVRYETSGTKVRLIGQQVFSNDREDPASLSSNIIFSIAPASDGRIWVGTRGGGLNLFDPGTGKSRRFMSGEYPLVNNDILFLYMDPDSTLWIGTSYGLSYLKESEVESGGFHSFTEADGLANNTIHGILSDDIGRIWLSTTRGISMFDPSDESFVNFFNYEELQSDEFSDGACFKSRDGFLYFGGVGGYNRFRQEDIHIRDYRPDVIFSELSIKQRQVEPFDPDGGVTLRHDENFFSINYFALDFIRGGNCEYAYLLEGFDDRWNFGGTYGTASFTNVPAGKYTLMVKCTNGDKVWNDTVYTLPIRVRHHWAATPWAFVIYFILIALLAAAALRMAAERLKQRDLLLMESMKNRQQKETYEAKLDFFTSISHEFSTPLTLIYGSGEYLQENFTLSPEIRRHLGIIRNNAARMRKLVGDIIDFRKVDTGKYVLRPGKVNLDSFISQVADNFVALADGDRIKFTINVPPSGDEVVTDRDALEIILYNLLSNAFKYTPADGFIQLDYIPGTDTDVVKVTNSGKGIKPEDLTKVFNRYEILGKLEKQMKKGKIQRNGIGLALAKSLAGALSGDITVESEPEKSTTFTLILPRVLTEDSVLEDSASGQTLRFSEIDIQESVPETNTREAPDSELPDSHFILIVDDERQICDLVSEILTKAGWKVMSASDGQEAVEILKNSRPDLIISDIVMPRMDGLELIKYLKGNEVTRQIPFVFLTFKDDIGFNIQGRDIGADAYLLKPFHPRLLVSVVKQILTSRASLKDYYGSVVSSKDMFEGITMDASDKEFLVSLTKWIEANIEESDMSFEELYSLMGMSRSNVYRKLQRLTGMSPSQFINSVKIHHAAHLLRSTNKTVQEIMYESGYNHKSHFYKEFSKIYGMTPREMRAESKKT
ncbi:MAG: response regulator [Bacteroidales bacterium]|nr:response regulator [Bacteroidales bacterium]